MPGKRPPATTGGRKRASERKARLGFTTMSRSIRAKCCECQGENSAWVRNCDVILCPLWPYRMGRSPRDEDLQVAQTNRLGEVVGHRPYLDELKSRAAGETRWPWEPHKAKLAEIEKRP